MRGLTPLERSQLQPSPGSRDYYEPGEDGAAALRALAKQGRTVVVARVPDPERPGKFCRWHSRTYFGELALRVCPVEEGARS